MPMSVSRKGAFTLVEMIAVMAIIVVLVGIVVPPVVSSLGGSQLTQATQQVMGQFASARQTALGKNRPVELRLYKYIDAGSAVAQYRAYQALVFNEDGTYTPSDRVQKLPPTIIISSTSSLTSFIGGTDLNTGDTSSLAETAPTTANTLPNLPTGYKYIAFQFRPDGSTSLVGYSSADPNNNKLWYLTLCDQKSQTVPPKNYSTIEIDPANGDVRLYRP